MRTARLLCAHTPCGCAPSPLPHIITGTPSGTSLVWRIVVRTEDEKLAQSSQPSDLFYLKQTIGNACGTIAIIHSICNNTKDLTLGTVFLFSTRSNTTHTLLALLHSASTLFQCAWMHARACVYVCHAAPGSFLSDFMSATKDMDASARGHFLEDPPQGGPDIEAAHQVCVCVCVCVCARAPGCTDMRMRT